MLLELSCFFFSYKLNIFIIAFNFAKDIIKHICMNRISYLCNSNIGAEYYL